MYIISPWTSQLRTASRTVAITLCRILSTNNKIIDPHNYLLMTLDGKFLHGLFDHERLKPVVIRTNQGNVSNLAHRKQVITLGILVK